MRKPDSVAPTSDTRKRHSVHTVPIPPLPPSISDDIRGRSSFESDGENTRSQPKSPGRSRAKSIRATASAPHPPTPPRPSGRPRPQSLTACAVSNSTPDLVTSPLAQVNPNIPTGAAPGVLRRNSFKAKAYVDLDESDEADGEDENGAHNGSLSHWFNGRRGLAVKSANRTDQSRRHSMAV